MDSQGARADWEAENEITETEIYQFDEDLQDRLLDEKPWKNDVHYFKRVRISAVALIKMVMHARSGGNIEIMGLMQGKFLNDEIIVLDAFGLPVEGTETRVNVGASANLYMVNYIQQQEAIGKPEGTIGWYHSHPGYNCWLSGIDCQTQMVHQQVEDPYLAIVVDPIKTLSSGKVEIGCYRTYPEDYNPPDADTGEYEHVPLNKIQDFGVHYKRYYKLPHSFFKSSMDMHYLDLLWNKYWAQTLSSQPLISNYEYASQVINDLSKKVEQSEGSAQRSIQMAVARRRDGNKLSQVARDASQIGVQQGKSLSMLMLQNLLFRG